MADEEKNNRPDRRSRIVAGGSVLSALGALVGASCCVLPLILVNLGVGTALISKLSFFAQAKPYFMFSAVILIAAAIVSSFWNGRRPSKAVIAILIVAMAFVLGSYILPFYEGDLLRWIGQK